MRYLIITTYESLWDAEVGILDNGTLTKLQNEQAFHIASQWYENQNGNNIVDRTWLNELKEEHNVDYVIAIDNGNILMLSPKGVENNG